MICHTGWLRHGTKQSPRLHSTTSWILKTLPSKESFFTRFPWTSIYYSSSSGTLTPSCMQRAACIGCRPVAFKRMTKESDTLIWTGNRTCATYCSTTSGQSCVAHLMGVMIREKTGSCFWTPMGISWSYGCVTYANTKMTLHVLFASCTSHVQVRTLPQ